MSAKDELADARRDLELNRLGELAPLQRRALAVTSPGYEAVAALALGSALVGVAGAVAALVWRSPLPRVAAAVLALASFALVAAGGAALLWKVVLPRLRPASPDPSRERVEAAEGAVSWMGQGWHAFLAPVGGAPPLALEPVLLPPGRYRFYLHAGKLVAAEALAPGGGVWSASSHLEAMGVGRSMWSTPSGLTRQERLAVGEPALLMTALAEVLSFTRDDLEANRSGVLSARQGQGQALACEGVAQLRWRMITKVTVRHSVELGGRSFTVSAQAFVVLVPGVAYRAYYAPPARLLSLEVLG
jgi:hypothetical protein